MKAPTGAKRVLIVSPCATHPANAGSRRRMLGLALTLRELGYVPELLYTDLMEGDVAAMRRWWGADFHFHPYRPKSLAWKAKRWLRRIAPEGSARRRWLQRARIGSSPMRPGGTPVVRHPDEYYDGSLDPVIDRLVGKSRYQAVILEYILMSRAALRCPAPIQTLLDTHEVFALGDAGATAPLEKNWIHVDAAGELEALARVNHPIAIQDNDAATLRRAGLKGVITFGHPVEIVEAASSAAALQSDQVLFVSGGHPYDVEGLKWFAEEVFPLVRDWLGPDRICVAGGIRDTMNPRPPFRFLGRVADLKALYAGARVVIAPLRQGTGLKIKVIEALGMGKAMVATDFAVRGMPASGAPAWLESDSAAAFAANLRTLMTDDGALRRVMTEARAYAVNWNQKQKEALAAALQPTG
ncbi:MAG TPA: glycosyltransferase family 4 protein [Candidatus Limnocylindria bacterium]|nr:glycosyltransferase family 4 protein [Candidatus Limnocylindria bacterium]